MAGITLDGNPYARVLNARFSFDHRTIPAPITRESAKRWAGAFAVTVAYVRDHGVRVVNMSWGFSVRDVERGTRTRTSRSRPPSPPGSS